MDRGPAVADRAALGLWTEHPWWAAGGPAEGAGLGAEQTASSMAGKGANPRGRGAALEEVARGWWAEEEAAAAGVAVPGARVGAGSDGRRELARALVFGAWLLRMTTAEGP